MKDITPNRGGAGSTYGGTQSPDPDAPDGYQKPKSTEKPITGKEASTPQAGRGKEYKDASSYGQKDDPAEEDDTRPGDKSSTEGEEEGSPVQGK